MIDEKKLIEDLVDTYCVDCSKCHGICRHDELFKIIDRQPKVDNWIPCSERLPENIRTVVLSIDEITFPTFGWYSQLEKRWILTERDYIGIEDFTVSAWMPLPAPYNAKRGGVND